MNKTLLVALSALTLLALPTVSAAPAPDTPDTMAQALGGGLVHVAFSLNPDVEPGDVVPLCDDAPDVPENRNLAGTVLDDCFQPAGSMHVGSLPLLPCDPVLVSILPANGPPASIDPNESCVQGLQEWAQRIISGDRLPVRTGIQLQT